MRISDWSSDVCSSDLDVAGSLGVADEVVGPHFAQLPVLPADQGLGCDDAAALEVDLGLVDQVELVVVGGPAQMGLDAEPVLLRLCQRRARKSVVWGTSVWVRGAIVG